MTLAAAAVRQSPRGSTRSCLSPTKSIRTPRSRKWSLRWSPLYLASWYGPQVPRVRCPALLSLTAPEAVEHALGFVVNSKGVCYDAVVSAGGETFMVYGLDKAHRISGISTGNKYASGTGELCLQQIRRLDAPTP